MSFDIIDTESCTCCETLNYERKITSVNSLIEAADYLFNHYDSEQILEGLFNEIVIRNIDSTLSASECLKFVGYTKEILDVKKKEKDMKIRQWLNLPLST